MISWPQNKMSAPFVILKRSGFTKRLVNFCVFTLLPCFLWPFHDPGTVYDAGTMYYSRFFSPSLCLSTTSEVLFRFLYIQKLTIFILSYTMTILR